MCATVNNKKIQRQGVGASGRGFFPTSTLGAGRLDQSGSFALMSVPSLKEHSSLASPNFSLAEENRRMKLGMQESSMILLLSQQLFSVAS